MARGAITGDLDVETLAILESGQDTLEDTIFDSALDQSFADYLDAHAAFGPVADEEGEVEVWASLLI